MKDFPDSWENVRRVNRVNDENTVLFTGHNKYAMCQLGTDAYLAAQATALCGRGAG